LPLLPSRLLGQHLRQGPQGRWGSTTARSSTAGTAYGDFWPRPNFSSKQGITGWWYTYPSEKYESQLGLLFPIYGKIKNVPNHQINM